MEEAVAEFVQCAKEFFDSRAEHAHAVNRAGVLFWRRLNWLSLADEKLKDCFCGRDRSPESISLYHKYRMQLLGGQKLRHDA
jgi:hypothetical protein